MVSIRADLEISPHFLYWEKNLDLTFRYANTSSIKAWGFADVNSMIGASDYDIPAKFSQCADIFRAHDQAVIEARKEIRLIEIQPFFNDGLRVLFVTKTPLNNNFGEIIGIKGYASDITSFIKNLPAFLNSTQSPHSQMAQQSFSLNIREQITSLSKRKQECLFYVIRGLSSKEVGKRLNLSARTIEGYIDYLKILFNCSSKSELIESCIAQGLLNFIPEHILNTQCCIPIS